MIITDSTPLDPNYCKLNPSTIDLWQFGLAESSEQASILNSDELVRAKRFYFEKHRRRFTIARTRLREILSLYLEEPAENLTFTYNKHGKPSVINQQQLEFNLSHSGDYALLAIGKILPLGVDLEKFSARPYLGIAQHLFSPQEQESVKNAPLYALPALFFDIWTQKEAFIKACGLGLAYPTQTFTVTKGAEDTIFNTLHQTTWKMHRFMPAIGVSAALCYHPSVTTLKKMQ